MPYTWNVNWGSCRSKEEKRNICQAQLRHSVPYQVSMECEVGRFLHLFKSMWRSFFSIIQLYTDIYRETNVKFHKQDGPLEVGVSWLTVHLTVSIKTSCSPTVCQNISSIFYFTFSSFSFPMNVPRWEECLTNTCMCMNKSSVACLFSLSRRRPFLKSQVSPLQ